MWQLLAIQALDLARERADEAARDRLARDARAFAAAERTRHGLATDAGPARSLAAAALRRVSAGLESASDAACDAASRLDHRTA